MFLFSERTDGRTDNMCENNDHFFGRRGLVGQKGRSEYGKVIKATRQIDKKTLKNTDLFI